MREPVSAVTNENVVWACLGAKRAEPFPAWAAPAARRPFLPLPPRGAPRRLHWLRGVAGGAPPRGEFSAALLPCGPGRRTAAAGLLRAEVYWGSRTGVRWARGSGARGSGGSAGSAEDGRGGRPGGSRVEPFAAALLPPTGVRPSHPWAETVQLQHPRAQYPG